MRKSKKKQTVKITFDACKSTGARKVQFRAEDSYADVSERQIIKITNNNLRYQQFKFNKMIC